LSKLYMLITIALSVGFYYIWSIVLNKNDNLGMVLGIIIAVFASAFFTKLKKR